MSRSAASPPLIMIGCAPEDVPALRGVAQRLRLDGFGTWMAADEIGPQLDQARALRDALRGAAAVVVGLSRRSFGADGKLVPPLARLAEVLTLTPGKRLIIALKLARAELPAELRGAEAVDLFDFSGYGRLRELLRTQVDRERAVAAGPAPAPAAPRLPALALSGRFALPALERQGQLRRIGRGVARAAYLLDGQRALVVAGGGAALLDLRDGAPRWTIDCPTGSSALSPSACLLALATGSLIHVWDLRDGRLLATCAGHSGPVSGLAFSPDERTLVSGGHDGSLRLWRVGGEGGPLGSPLAALPAHGEQVTSVAVSPDGTLIASGSQDRSVRVWRAIDRSLAQTLSGHGGAVEALAFSPDGATLAAGSRGRSVRLWDTRRWHPRLSLEPHGGAVEALAFSPDSALIASGAADGTVRLWRAADGGLARALAGHGGPVVGVSFGPKGAGLASLGADGELLLWATAEGTQTASLRPLSARVTALAFSDEGELLAAGTADGAAAVYRAAGEAPPEARHAEHRGAVTGLAFAAPLRLLSTAADQTVRTCRMESGETATLLQTHGALQATALAPGGSLLATSDGEMTVQLWRLSAAEEHPGAVFWRVLRGLPSRPRLVAFAPGGAAVAAACEDGSVAVWRLDGQKAQRDSPSLMLRSDAGRVRSLAFSPDGAQLAAGGETGAAQIWRVADGAGVRLGGPGAAICGLAFSRDGLSLAAGTTQGDVAIWRLAAAERRRGPATTIAGHAGAVEQLAFSPAGGLLASGSADGTVRLWRV